MTRKYPTFFHTPIMQIETIAVACVPNQLIGATWIQLRTRFTKPPSVARKMRHTVPARTMEISTGTKRMLFIASAKRRCARRAKTTASARARSVCNGTTVAVKIVVFFKDSPTYRSEKELPVVVQPPRNAGTE